MKERPILFSGHMVRAILEGRKTMTRRVVKISRIDPHPQLPAAKIVTLSNGSQAWMNSQIEHPHHISKFCPYGQVGDRLWVRESMLFDPDQGWRYSADGADVIDENYGKINQRCPSIHMPRSCCRILLEITGVRVERLHEISEADAQAEGVERVVAGVGWRRYCDPDIEEVGVPPCGDARRSFRSLWKHINGDESWNANPWVWVVEFKRVQP